MRFDGRNEIFQQPDDGLIPHHADPFCLFAEWFERAASSGELRYPNAACLATVEPDGGPDGRTVQVQQFDPSGFVFYTDDRSPKAAALKLNPVAALVFYWSPVELQVRIRGAVHPESAAVSDLCFRERPRASRITAWTCRQSAPLADRAALLERFTHVEARFAGVDDVPRPPYWRAFRLVPDRFEFWRAAARRLHDRVAYQREGHGAWHWQRLEP